MRAHQIITLSLVAVLVTVLFAGVGPVSVAARPARLSVTSVDPADNTARVPTTAALTVTFNKAIQRGAHYDKIVLKRGTTKVSVTTRIAGTELTITPDVALAHGREYTLTIPRDAVKSGATALATHFTSTFTTVAAPKAFRPTRLTAIAPPAVSTDKAFAIRGSLHSGGRPHTHTHVTLQRSTDDTIWTTVTTSKTNAKGRYSFSVNEDAAGTYYYRTYYGKPAHRDRIFSPIVKISISGSTTQTIYYIPQAGATWVNRGSTGESYNAHVSTPGLYRTQANGHSYWGDTGQHDFVSIPAGGATNNQNVASWEIGFHYNGVVPGQRFQKIWDKAWGGYMIEIDTAYGNNAGQLTIYRATTGGARWYISTDTMFRAGHNYYVQIAWDTRAGPGHEPYPTIWIGEDGKAPVRQTHWDETGGALNGAGSWYNDAQGPANLGNTAGGNGANSSAKTAWLNGGFYVYRQYSSIVDFSSGGSWNVDRLAWAS